MALSKPNAAHLKRALVAGVADFMDKDDPLAPVLIQANQGLHVFTLGIQDILDGGEGIRGVKSAGWRFLAGNPLGPAIAGDVIAPSGAPPRMTSLSRDPLIGRAIRAIHEVETLPAVKENDYELLVLRIPGLLIEAFWLKSQTSKPDLVVPVLTRARTLEVMKPYPLDDFLMIARSMAEGFLKFDELQN